MRFYLRNSYWVFNFLITLAATSPARAQETRFEFWPELDVWHELQPNLNLFFFESITRSRETRYTDAQTAANIDFRWFPGAIYPLALSFRAGYSYSGEISENPEPYREHRAIVDFTPRYSIAQDLILFDRNRVEFRWVNSDYSNRYRNRLRLEYRPTIREKIVNIYLSGEVVYDYSARRWVRNYIQTGIEVPLAWYISIELNFTRQNSKGSSAPDHVNALGTVVTLFF